MSTRYSLRRWISISGTNLPVSWWLGLGGFFSCNLTACPEFPLPPSSIVLRLTELNCFDRALSTARSLKVDMADTFTRLTMQCLHLSREPDFVLYVARGVLFPPPGCLPPESGRKITGIGC